MPRRSGTRVQHQLAIASRRGQLIPAEEAAPTPPPAPEPEQQDFSVARWNEEIQTHRLFRRIYGRIPQRSKADRQKLQRLHNAVLTGNSELLEKLALQGSRASAPPLAPPTLFRWPIPQTGII